MKHLIYIAKESSQNWTNLKKRQLFDFKKKGYNEKYGSYNVSIEYYYYYKMDRNGKMMLTI